MWKDITAKFASDESIGDALALRCVPFRNKQQGDIVDACQKSFPVNYPAPVCRLITPDTTQLDVEVPQKQKYACSFANIYKETTV